MDRWLLGKKKSTANSIQDYNQDDHQDEQTKEPSKKRRQYSSEYLSLGFTSVGPDDNPRPVCVICTEVLSNEALKPCKLRRHLQTKHGQLLSKPKEFFENKLREYMTRKKAIQATCVTGGEYARAVEASYKVAKLIAQTGKPHTIGEDLILPAAKEMVSVMIDDKAAKKLNVISLSDNTVKRRIDDMAQDVLKQLLARIKSSRFFALQIDESTDITALANLLAFVRYEHNGEIHEEFLFCKPLRSNTTAEAVFEVMNEFMVANEIEWGKCVGLSTDGARAMVGRLSGVVKRVKDVAPLLTPVHCSIHREALATKTMPANLKMVLDEAVKTVNFIKSRPLQSRLFGILCAEMGSKHHQLLLHTEVRWLSRGKVLTRLYELRDEVRVFFVDKTFELSDRFCDFVWLSTLAYLADIFEHLNGLNLSLQGKSVTVFQVQNKIEASIKKFELWDRRVAQNNYESFDSLCDFLRTEEERIPSVVASSISAHLQGLGTQLRSYFPSLNKQHNWIQNPFVSHDQETIAGLACREQDNLVELSCDSSLKLIFAETHLASFWMRIYAEYPELANKALRLLMPFTTTYLCETGFSALVGLKTKYRNRLDVGSDLRLKLTSIQPDIGTLTAAMQHHPSH
ncbi:zinc finger BED domain-containing protein 5 [Gouania willdenowi]|nr:zinc finger BED domain-containing protein 5 [Gouania willdenowi]